MKTAQARWKEIGPVPRQQANELWERFRTVCDEQFARVKAYYEQLDKERDANLERKLELVKQAEALQESTDWRETGDALKALQEQWKEIGPAPRQRDQQVYGRFRQACDHFFGRAREHFEEQQAERLENQQHKEAICVKAEELRESSDWWDTIADIKSLRERWKDIGPAPHDQEEALWQRFQAACQVFFDRLDAVRPDHLKQKEAICEEAETLVADPGDTAENTVADRLKELQAAWREIGPAPQEQEQGLWDRFRKACDTFFGARREHFREIYEEREEKLTRKRAILEEAEHAAEHDAGREVADKLKALQQEWKEIGPIPTPEDAELYQQFRQLCNAFFEERKQEYQEFRATLLENQRRKEELCARLESLLGQSPANTPRSSTLDLADELRIALESNFVLGSENAEGRRHAAFDEVKKIQAVWKSIGPVPRRVEQSLWRRYRAALDTFYGNRRQENRSDGDRA